MPRDPKDISLSATQRLQRRIAEASDLREPAFLRSGAGAAGAEGPEGPPGANGAKWFASAGAPAGGLGVTGDFYLNTTNDDVYEKQEGGWTLIANFQGEKGEKGATGTNGTNGAEGPAGSLENTDWKNSVRVATTANIATATALNPGDVLDGITLAENDRVLVKNQTTKSQNGIWIVKASPSRALDADAAGELSGGSTVYVEQGTRNARRNFQISTVGPITPGTTAHDWAAIGNKDFGIVEALPTSEAIKGDKCAYKAGTGVYWDLIYTEEATYPWAKIGGPSLRVVDPNTREGTQTTYQTTGAPSVNAPLAGEYGIIWGALRQGNGNVSPGDAGSQTCVFINAVEQSALTMEFRDDNQHRGSPSRGREVVTVPSGQAVQTRYRALNVNGYRIVRMFIELDPLRVG